MNAVAIYYAVRALVTDRKGVTAIEYGVIAALIIVVCVGILVTVGTNLSNTFTTISNNL